MSKEKIRKTNYKFYISILLIAVLGTVFLFATRAQDSTNSFSRFPGDPNPRVTGKAYWGSAIAGNGDPSRHEGPTGKSLSIRRTYWDMRTTGKIDTSVNSAKNDIDNNRLPFISYKLKHSWVDTANGADQAAIDDLLRRLDNLGGPVWLVIHHEPEGSATTNWADEPTGPSSWVDMQKYIRSRMNAVGTENIAFMANLMSWTWDSQSGRNPDEWWAPNVWDAYIVDSYAEKEGFKLQEDVPGWTNFVSWIEQKGLPFGTAEWGMRTVDGGSWLKASGDTGQWTNEDCQPSNMVLKNTTNQQEAVARENMRSLWEYSLTSGKDIIAQTYFDSCLNSKKGPWTLAKGQLEVFQDILKNDNRIMRISDLSSTDPNPDPVCEDSAANNTGQSLPCTYDSDPPGDLPITITSPNNGDKVSGTVSVTTGPDTDVQELSFRVNGVWQSNDAQAPFTWQWDTTKFPDGETTLTIRARRNGDPGGVYTEKSIKVTIQNSSATKQCDFDGDNKIGLQDLARLLSNYDKNVTVNTDGDCDGDGRVSLSDLAKLLSLYGQ